jgi:hypothetical protein
MIRRRTPMTAALICAALGLHGLAHASPPTCRSQCGKHPPHSVSSGVIVRAPSLSLRSSFQVASLETLGDASPTDTQSQRSPGLSWTLVQSPPRKWTEGQPIALSVGLGPSNPRYGGVRGSRPLADAATPLVTSPAAATGWTRPLGMRLSIRW